MIIQIKKHYIKTKKKQWFSCVLNFLHYKRLHNDKEKTDVSGDKINKTIKVYTMTKKKTDVTADKIN